MKGIAKIWNILALVGMFFAGGTVSVQAENVQKLPAVKTDTVFYDEFLSADVAKEEWLIVDNNKDGRTWNFTLASSTPGNSYELSYGYSNIKADDYAISKFFTLKADRVYRLSYFANNLYYEEDVEMWLGTERDVAHMNMRLDSTHVSDMPNGTWRTQTFTVPSDGQYCLAVRAVSAPNSRPGLYVDNIAITVEIEFAVPAPVVGLVQVPGNKGTGMQLKWKNPSQNEKGDFLTESLSAIEIYKNYGNTAQAYNLSLAPGAEVIWTDPDPQPGKVTYHVYAVNASGRSYPSVVNTFVGEDLPSAPRNLKVAVNGNDVTLTWDEPGEFGQNGGWYDKQNITYLVAKNPNYTVLETALQAKTKTDAVAELGYFYYEVTARNAKGLGQKAVSEGIKAGTAMNLPYHEEFEDEESFRALWSMADLNNDGCVWTRETYRGNLKPGAAWYNWLLGRSDRYDNTFNPPPANDYLFSPLMRFEKGKNYRLRYWVKGVIFSDIHLRVSLGKTANSQAMSQLLDNVVEGSLGDFTERSAEFTVPETGSFCIGFLYHTDDGYLWIDDLWVEEIAANDLAVSAIKGSHTPKKGESTTYVVTVENKGTASARNYKVRLLDQAGNELAASAEQTRPVASGRTNDIAIEWTPQNTDVFLVRAEVVWADDEVAKNNIGEGITVRMQGDGYRAVQIGDGEIKSYSVPWYVYNEGFGQTVYPISGMQGLVGTIRAISYQLMVGFETNKPLEDQHFRIWMGESDRYDMSAGWFGKNELTCVFDSTVTIENGCYDWYLPLQHAYDYRGGNLVICIEGRNPYGTLGHSGMYFLCTESSTSAVHRSTYGYGGVSMDDDEMNNLVGSFYSIRPNTTFYFDISGMGSLQGKVSEAGSNAMADVRVTVNGLNGSRTTDASGNYEFPYVPAGSNTVNFSKVGYEDQSLSASIAAGTATSLNVTMQSKPEVKVSGVIVGSDNPHKGLPLVELTLDGPSKYTVVTDENGCYSIENVYGNLTYTARIQASGYSDYAEPFEVKASDLVADTIVLLEMINMPSSVTAYDKTDYALVEWTDPVPVAWLQLDQGSIYGSFGGNSDQAYVVGHRYTPQDFEKRGITSASAITKVRFWPDAVATFVLQIYAGEKNVESLVREEKVNIDQFGEWFEYDLQQPVAIDPSKHYIVALKVQQSSGSHPVGFDRGPAVENGDLFSSDNGRTWLKVAMVSPSMNYNWLIHTYCSANPNSTPTDPAELLSVRPTTGNLDFLGKYGSSEFSMPALNNAPAVAAQNAVYTLKLCSKAKRKASELKKEAPGKATEDYTYEVYRLLNGEEQDQSVWTKLTENPIADMQLRDLGWHALKDTLWRYAVRSVRVGSYSDYTFSRAVDKGKYVDVRVKVLTNTGEKAYGATVQLKGINNTYTATVNQNDSAYLANIHYGTYDITVRKEGFVTYTEKDIVLDSLHYDLGTITLTEDVRPPLEFNAVDWVDYVDCSWEKPRRQQEVELSKTQSEFNSGYGINAGGDMSVGHRYTPQELQNAGVDGFYINSISFYPAASADFTVKVWKSDNVGNEKEAYSQTVSSADLVMEQWNTIVLDEPVLINAEQSYIIGYNAYMSPGSYPIGSDNGPLVTDGDLLFFNNNWVSFCSYGPAIYNFNWMIRATVSNIRGASKTLSKADGDDFNYTYELYRFTEANIANPASWSKLSGNDFKELGYVDNDWKNQADGNYYYAVFSRSQTGNTSDTVLSAMLPKGKVSVVTVKATTNNGTSAQGATVRLFNAEKTYSAVLGAEGSVEVPAVLKASYTLEIEKPHFEKLTKTVSISDTKTVLEGNELKEKLDKPIVRAFKRSDAEVRVDWYSPVNPGSYPHYITWSTETFFTGIGQQNSGFSASCAHKYTTSDLADNNVVGMYIYKIRFYPASQETQPTRGTYRVQIWEGEDGIAVLSQNVPSSSIKYNEWNEVVLDKPYYIDGTKTVLVGYTANLTQGWGCGIDRGPAVRGRGNMINVDGSWAHITDLSPDLDYNWMIQAYCTDAIEAGVEESKAVKADGEDFVKSYTVYRLREGDMTVPDRWTLLKENTTEKTLQDSHADLPDDWYMYAVKAIYATGESAYAFSDHLGKGVANEELEEAGFESLVINPNPNKGIFSLNLPYNGRVSVYALDGSLVWQADRMEGVSQFDLNLPAGLYTLVLSDGKRKAAGRFIIIR
ncbi:MAG: carboxypeptidase regulatory-like domain-containing protein [Lentimicrobiaceae bacterium]|nr:carboxypeptidase regulatory-like domain-containing protein [Lentimicrobiaceae bacterium]